MHVKSQSLYRHTASKKKKKNPTSYDEKQAKLLLENFIKPVKPGCKCLKEGRGSVAGFTAWQDSKSFIGTVAWSYMRHKYLAFSLLKDSKVPLNAAHEICTECSLIKKNMDRIYVRLDPPERCHSSKSSSLVSLRGVLETKINLDYLHLLPASWLTVEGKAKRCFYVWEWLNCKLPRAQMK